LFGVLLHPVRVRLEGFGVEEYERWLFEVHGPALLANPYLDRIVFNKVLRPVRQASGGTAEIPEGYSCCRIAKMHFADETAYEWYRQCSTTIRCRQNVDQAAAPASSSTCWPRPPRSPASPSRPPPHRRRAEWRDRHLNDKHRRTLAKYLLTGSVSTVARYSQRIWLKT
jgi:hypothetical protein